MKCHQQNGPISGYIYQLYHDLVHFSEGIVHDTIITLPFIGGSFMQFSVAAMNEAGVGEYSPPFTIQQEHFEPGKHIYAEAEMRHCNKYATNFVFENRVEDGTVS